MKLSPRIKMGVIRFIYTRKIFLTFFAVIFIITLFLYNRESYIEDIDRSNRLQKIDELIRSNASSMACKQPNLPVNAPDIMKFVKQVPPIDCKKTTPDWVVCEGSECKIHEHVKIQHGPMKCSFTDVLRVDDFHLTDGGKTNSDSYYKLEQSDLVAVSCQTAEKEKWSSVLTGIRFDKEVWDRTGWENVPQDALKMNVLMFGFDSLSRNTFIRKLPKSYKYLKEVLNTYILEGYNIVGDGTPQALIPILTGKTELELPDTRKRLPNTHFVNSYPFIWNDFQEGGYATAYLEDTPGTGIFTYRLNGFKKTPTDHYMRPYYLAANKELKKWPKFCAGSIPRHKIMLNHIKNFFSVYKSKPKFLFGFHGELSHDNYNLIGAADEDVLEFLKDLRTSGALNNTVFIFMADHGHRFADIRNTIQGKQEERLPFFSFTFPEWFKRKYKSAHDNFLSNLNKLTTPFDIYSTLMDVLHFQNKDVADISSRSVSLFSKIPETRSCAHAYIEPHWCACLEWNNVPETDPIVKRLGQTVIDTLNNYTKSHRNLCAILGVGEILLVTKMRPNDNLIKFNKNADIDGFVADLTAKTKLLSDMYQIKVSLQPGDSLFEASISHFLKSNELQLKLKDISRTNMYGSQARCIENDYPNLRKYCYCVT